MEVWNMVNKLIKKLVLISLVIVVPAQTMPLSLPSFLSIQNRASQFFSTMKETIKKNGPVIVTAIGSCIATCACALGFKNRKATAAVALGGFAATYLSKIYCDRREAKREANVKVIQDELANNIRPVEVHGAALNSESIQVNRAEEEREQDEKVAEENRREIKKGIVKKASKKTKQANKGRTEINSQLSQGLEEEEEELREEDRKKTVEEEIEYLEKKLDAIILEEKSLSELEQIKKDIHEFIRLTGDREYYHQLFINVLNEIDRVQREEKNNKVSNQCCICLSDENETREKLNEFVQCPSGNIHPHKIHQSCLYKSLRTTGKCPICRFSCEGLLNEELQRNEALLERVISQIAVAGRLAAGGMEEREAEEINRQIEEIERRTAEREMYE